MSSAVCKKQVAYITHSAARGGGELSLLDIVEKCPFGGELILLSEGDLLADCKKRGLRHQVIPLFIERKTNLFKTLLFFVCWPYNFIKFCLLCLSVDLIYTNSQKAHFICFPIKKILSKKWIVHYRDFIDRKAYLGFSRYILNSGPSLILANSLATKSKLHEVGISKQTEVVYNYFAMPIEKNLTIQPKRITKVFYPSRLSYWKGQKEFLEALSKIKGKLEVSMIAGKIFNEKLGFDLDSLVAQLGKNIHLKLIPFQPDIRSLYEETDLVVHIPSEPEPFGRVTIEAILMKKLVLVSSHASVDGLVKDGVTGFVVESNNSEAVAIKIDQLLERNPQDFASICDEAYAQATKLCSYENTLAKVYGHISNILV